jgi:hypothetical protein
MLKHAKLYEDQLKRLYIESTFDPYFKYAITAPYRDELKLTDTTWTGHQFVSVHEEKVIGYINYDIERSHESVTNFLIMHFGNEYPYVFGKDVMIAVRDIFEKYGLRKLAFGVVIGNPIEKTYDKLAQRYGGRIVGIYEKEKRLIDGQFYDFKTYEILATNYFLKNKKREAT